MAAPVCQICKKPFSARQFAVPVFPVEAASASNPDVSVGATPAFYIHYKHIGRFGG